VVVVVVVVVCAFMIVLQCPGGAIWVDAKIMPQNAAFVGICWGKPDKH
jgi:hypothetical protein